MSFPEQPGSRADVQGQRGCSITQKLIFRTQHAGSILSDSVMWEVLCQSCRNGAYKAGKMRCLAVQLCLPLMTTRVVSLLESPTRPPSVAGPLLTWLLQSQMQSPPDKIHMKVTPIDISLVPVSN